MLGAAHAAANPLTTHFGIVHGHAVGLMLPQVVRFNGEDAVARATYKALTDMTGISDSGKSHMANLVERIEMVLRLTQLPRTLALCGVKRAAIPMLAKEAAQQWTAAFNPRPVAQSDFVKLYEAALT